VVDKSSIGLWLELMSTFTRKKQSIYKKKLKVTIKYNNNNTSNNTIHVKNKT